MRILLLMMTRTYRAGAFMDAADRLGVEVVAASEVAPSLAPHNPEGHLTLDFSAPSRAAAKIVRFARTRPIDAIVPADDDGVVIAALAAEQLGLRHNTPESVRAARDKHATRSRLKEAGLPVPEFREIPLDGDPEAESARMSYPCVLKPLALSASRGVIRADDREQFVSAFHRISRMIRAEPSATAPAILVESFMPGEEVAVEGLLAEGRLRVLAIYDKPDPLDGPFFQETIYVTPSRHLDDLQAGITTAVQEAVSALGLTDGPVHAEVRLTPDGPRILEVAPRSIGGHCSRTLRFGEGITLEDLLLRHALRLPGRDAAREPGAAGVMMIPIPRAGRLEQVAGADEAAAVPGVEEVELSIPVGREAIPPPEGSRYLGFIFARMEDPGAVETALRQAHSRLRFTIEPLQ